MGARIWLAGLLLSGIAPFAAAAPLACPAVAGDAALFAAGRTVLVGEIHGTKEHPAFFAALVCHALERKLRVVVGIEHVIGEEGALRDFLASDGGSAARNALLARGMWTGAGSQDGRHSGAMLELIETLRRWTQAGLPLKVVTLDMETESSTRRAERMARRVRAERAQDSEALILTLTGNAHNPLADPAGRPGMKPMGALLVDLRPDSLGPERENGTYFNFELRQRPETSRMAAAGFAIAPSEPLDRIVYTHRYTVGGTTASPPASR